jgi:hypothetical protein
MVVELDCVTLVWVVTLVCDVVLNVTELVCVRELRLLVESLVVVSVDELDGVTDV